MEFIATVQAGKLVLPDAMLEIQEAFLHRIPDGAQVKVTMTRVGKEKTLQQLRCHWGLVVGTIRHAFDEQGMDLGCFLRCPSIPEGQPVPADVIQAVLYATCNDVGDNGERKTLSKMNTVEASRFFERCRSYAASAWGIQIPDPVPTWTTHE